MIEMQVSGVRLELPAQQPVLMLSELAGPRSLPIVIGTVEAAAIASHLQGMEPPRPFTHDLFVNTIGELGHELIEVRVTDFREGTYYGELVFAGDVTVSARPSDAIALAVRIGCPVQVSEEVLDAAGIVLDPDEDGDDDVDLETVDADSEVEAFREFLDNVSPDDFGPERS